MAEEGGNTAASTDPLLVGYPLSSLLHRLRPDKLVNHPELPARVHRNDGEPSSKIPMGPRAMQHPFRIAR